MNKIPADRMAPAGGWLTRMVQMSRDTKPKRIVVVEQVIFAVEIHESTGVVDPALLRCVVKLRTVPLGECLGLAGFVLRERTRCEEQNGEQSDGDVFIYSLSSVVLLFLFSPIADEASCLVATARYSRSHATRLVVSSTFLLHPLELSFPVLENDYS